MEPQKKKFLPLNPMTCPSCLSVFKPQNQKTKFCSRKCFQIDRKKKDQPNQDAKYTQRDCLNCGFSFVPKRGMAKSKFCSHSCYIETKTEQKEKNAEYRTCQGCLRLFPAYKGNGLLKGRGKYCSKECISRHLRCIAEQRGQIGKCANCEKEIRRRVYCSKECRTVVENANKRIATCLYCAKVFHAKSRKGLYCSRDCRYRHHEETTISPIISQHYSSMPELYKDLGSVSKICKELGYTEYWVKKCLREQGVTIRSNVEINHTRTGTAHPLYGKAAQTRSNVFIYCEHLDRKLRSKWEHEVALALLSCEIVHQYESHSLKLISTKQTYTPDFYLPRQNVFIEVKGFWRESATSKMEMLAEEQPSLLFVFIEASEMKEIKKDNSSILQIVSNPQPISKQKHRWNNN